MSKKIRISPVAKRRNKKEQKSQRFAGCVCQAGHGSRWRGGSPGIDENFLDENFSRPKTSSFFGCLRLYTPRNLTDIAPKKHEWLEDDPSFPFGEGNYFLGRAEKFPGYTKTKKRKTQSGGIFDFRGRTWISDL